MESLFSEIKAELAHDLYNAVKACGYDVSEPSVAVDISKAFGDVSSPIALKIAKQIKSDPMKVAQKIASAIKIPEYVTKITSENGFLNFHFGRTQFLDLFLNHTLLEKTLRPVPMDKKVVVEYIGVNPNKPWHVGHLRNALIGDCLSNVYLSLGYAVERENYIDDLGLQVAEIVWWYEKNKLSPSQTKKFDVMLGEEYVKANAYISGHETEAKAEVSKVLSSMEQDGTYESKLARDIVSKCVLAQYETAFAFGIYQHLMVWESDIVHEKLLEKSLEILKRSGFAKLQVDGDFKGCIIINLKESAENSREIAGLANSVKVLVRSDGNATYLAKDIAFHMWKFGVVPDNFKYAKFIEKQPNGAPIFTTSPQGESVNLDRADIAVNVIDVRQSHPQMIMRLAFESIGKNEIANNIVHIAYGEVELESGGLSGRSGNWIGYSADEILAEAIVRSRKLITSRLNFNEAEREKVARAVALSAIKFEFLKYGIEKKITFSWDKALNFESGSGPYHQYMHARASRIIEEGASVRSKVDTSQINDYEFNLSKQMAIAQEMIEKACQEGRPNVITDYLNDLSSQFSSFYDNCPVLKAGEGKVGLRLELTNLFKETSARMLALLGIEAISRM